MAEHVQVVRDEQLSAHKLEHRHRAQSIIQSKALDELETEVLTTGLYESVDLSLGSRITVVVAESVYAFIWWSVVSALVSAAWCYKRTSGGLESVTVVAWLSPLLLSVGLLQKVVHTPLGLALLRAGTMAGLLFTHTPTALVKFALLCAGNACAILSLCAQWWSMSGLDLHRRVYCHMLGHLLVLALRVWGATFNPVYTSLSANQFVCGAGTVAVLYLYSNDYRTPVVKNSASDRQRQDGQRGLGTLGVRFGAILFLTLSIFGDLYVVPQWAGFSASPYPWCIGILSALSCGFTLFSYREELVQHISWDLVGLLSSLVLLITSCTGLVGGCVFAMYVASQMPLLVKKLVAFPAWKALGASMAAAISFTVLSYVTHSFGLEGRHFVVVVVVLVVGLSLEEVWIKGIQKSHQTFTKLAWREPKTVTHKKSSSHPGRPYALRHRLPTIEEDEKEEEEGEEEGEEEEEEEEGCDITFAAHTVHEEREKEMASLEKHEERCFNSRVITAALLIVAFATCGPAHNYYHHPSSSQEWPGVFSSAIWEFHVDCENNFNMLKDVQLIEDAGLGVVAAMSATPIRTHVTGHDYSIWLSQKLNMYVEVGSVDGNMNILVFSKYPIIEAKNTLTAGPEAINISGVFAAINISGTIVDFYCLYFEDDVAIIDTQTKGIELLMSQMDKQKATMIMVYFSTPSGYTSYNRLMAASGLKNINHPEDDESHFGVYYNHLIRVARVSLDNMQVARLRLSAYPGEEDADTVTSDGAKLPTWYHVTQRHNSHSPNLHSSATRYFVHANTTQ